MLDDISGSDIYYSALAAPQSKRALFTTAHLFCQTVMSIAECYQEKSVAEGKLLWWEQEIQRFTDGCPSHPLTKELLGLNEFQINPKQLSAIVESALTAIHIETFESEQSLFQHYQHTGGLIEAIKAQIILGRALNGNELKACHQCGIGSEIIRHINLAAEHIHRNVDYFPEPYAKQAEHAKQLLANATMLPRALRVYYRIQLKLLTKIECDQFQVDRYRYTLSPLQKLIQLWRTR